MQSDDPPNFATDDGQIGFYHPDMGSGDMMEDKADGFTSEELDDIVEPNWREEVRAQCVCLPEVYTLIISSYSFTGCY